MLIRSKFETRVALSLSRPHEGKGPLQSSTINIPLCKTNPFTTNMPRLSVLCCRCHNQVTINGDVRFKSAKIGCGKCSGHVHEECTRQHKPTKCQPLSMPLGFKVSGCICGRQDSCYYECLEGRFRVVA